jgi:RNA polymerase sigma-70 factor (ECF subfamily)
MPDVDNIRRMNSESASVFKQLFESLYPKLMGLACRFVDEETAKDLVQEVFMNYWEQQEAGIANVTSYLYKSTQNKCLNYLKHQSVVEGYAQQLSIAQARIDYLTRIADDNELFSQISNQNLLEVIESSVEKLPPKCREAFRLCYFHDMTCKEAAEVMGISPRTVEGHVQKAVVQLREDLSPLLIWILIVYIGI